jgi:hypothetical protein
VGAEAAVRGEARSPDQGRTVIDALGLVNRGIQLEPAADAFLRRCRAGAPPAALAREGLRVCEDYRRLAEDLAGLGLASPAAAAAVALFDHHMRLVRVALDLAYRPQTAEIAVQRERLTGLGPSAGRLVVLRDRLARDAPRDLLDPLAG